MRRSPNIIYVGDTVNGERVTDVVAYYGVTPTADGPQGCGSGGGEGSDTTPVG